MKPVLIRILVCLTKDPGLERAQVVYNDESQSPVSHCLQTVIHSR